MNKENSNETKGSSKPAQDSKMTAKTNNESIKSHIMIKILLNTIQIHKSIDIRTTKNHVKR
jgi:hypothetical protein